MQRIGFRLVDAEGDIAAQWGGSFDSIPGIPNPLILPNGDQVCGVELGGVYDGFTLQSWDAERPPQTIFDGADFLGRITDEEYAAIIAAASQNAQLGRWLDIFRLRGEIDVAGATAQAAKAGMVAMGLLTQERADEVFSTR